MHCFACRIAPTRNAVNNTLQTQVRLNELNYYLRFCWFVCQSACQNICRPISADKTASAIAACSTSLCTSADCRPTVYCVGRHFLLVPFVDPNVGQLSAEMNRFFLPCV